MDQYLERVVNLVPASANRLYGLTVEEAEAILLAGPPEAVRTIEGSFALVAKAGKTVRMARSLDRPLRYFLAKRQAGPALVVAQRIDTIAAWLKSEGLSSQFHPSYTRMVPAHYVVEIQLIGCPDPNPAYTRFFTPKPNGLQADPAVIGERYISALTVEIEKWIRTLDPREPIGVCFSGGIDSGAVFLAAYHVLRRLGMSLGRLKAFTLAVGDAPDLEQARAFLDAVQLGLFLEPIETTSASLDPRETVRLVEDYKPLDIQSATMAFALCQGIRRRYPDWRFLLDGDGGDENLKDYPIEENPELTIRSVINNRLLYQEGWGVNAVKHSLTYSGGLSRAYTRTFAPADRCGFEGFSPFTRPQVVEIAEEIPFLELTQYDVEKLYSLKGEIVAHGIKKVTGFSMSVFPKRRFQHGAVSSRLFQEKLPGQEIDYRKEFLALYA